MNFRNAFLILDHLCIILRGNDVFFSLPLTKDKEDLSHNRLDRNEKLLTTRGSISHSRRKVLPFFS